MNRYYIISIFYFVLGMSGCTKDPFEDIILPDDKIVIDGWIEQGQYPKVLLTSNAPYFTELDSASLRELVLSRAKVTISNGTSEEVLTLRRNDNYFPPYIYEGVEIKGEVGKTYTITAEYGGKKATSETTINQPVNLDSIWYDILEDRDTLASIEISFTDNGQSKDYYRVLTKRRGIDSKFISSAIMAVDDQYFNGKTFGFEVLRGAENFLSSKNDVYFAVGDTVDIKFCTVDKASFDFWRSFQDEMLNAGNPFAASMSSVKSNVEGDGVGIWCGYGSSNYSLIIKETSKNSEIQGTRSELMNTDKIKKKVNKF